MTTSQNPRSAHDPETATANPKSLFANRPHVTHEQAISQNVIKVTKPAEPWKPGTKPFKWNQPSDVTFVKDIVYKEAPYFNHPIALKMDLWLPEGKTDAPLIVAFPGEGFIMADRRGGLGYTELVQADFALASVEYRVGLGAQYPTLIDDALSAINFLREHGTDYGIDSSRIALLGSSAGGYVTTMAALKDGGVRCVVDRYGVADLDLIGAGLDKAFEEVYHFPAATEAILLNGAAFGTSPGASVFETPEKTFATSPSSLASPLRSPVFDLPRKRKHHRFPCEVDDTLRRTAGSGRRSPKACARRHTSRRTHARKPRSDGTNRSFPSGEDEGVGMWPVEPSTPTANLGRGYNTD